MRRAILLILLASCAWPGICHAQVELGPAPCTQDSDLTIVDEVLSQQVTLNENTGLVVNARNRADVVGFYESVYSASLGIDAGWDGDVDTCDAGTTLTAFKDAVVLRVNYFRAMAGLPANITLQDTYSEKCQEAALMMIAEGKLDHTPDQPWQCWTSEGYEAAGKSLLSIGAYGPAAVDNYVEDFGAGNTAVGHRRWILYPPELIMGSGSTSARNGAFTGSDALWVIGSQGPRPDKPEFVAWPPAGYIPDSLVYPRWSFAVNESRLLVDFSQASIEMSEDGQPITTAVISSTATGYGDNTIVWEPEDLSFNDLTTDRVCDVTVRNVVVDGVAKDYSYSVAVIDPEQGCGPLYDGNEDGFVDATDAIEVIDAVVSPQHDLRQDYNCDGMNDYEDLLLFMQHWNPETSATKGRN